MLSVLIQYSIKAAFTSFIVYALLWRFNYRVMGRRAWWYTRRINSSLRWRW